MEREFKVLLNNQVPRMRTIDEVAKLTGLSYKSIRALCLNNKIVYIKAGRKYLVNLDKFFEYLNTGERQDDFQNQNT